MRTLDTTAERGYGLEGLRGTQRWASVRAVTWLSIVIIAVGVLLRVGRYLADRSLWLDESYLALNLMTRSYRGLLETLDYNQGAPIGFLWAERTMLSLFGDSELALRSFPLAVSIAALLLFYAVARDLLRSVALLVALLLFATIDPFIRYAAEVKQYGIDVAVTVALLYVFMRIVEDGVRDVRGSATLALAGPLAVFFSHPSVFVLTGVAAAGIALALQRGDPAALRRQLVAYSLWLLSFIVVYLVAVRDLHELQRTVRGVGAGTTGGLKNLYTIFSDPGGLPRTAVGLAAALCLVGVFSLWRRRLGVVILATAASGSLLVAGYLGVYPVGQRFLLFLLPVAVLFLAEGVGAIVEGAPPVIGLALTLACVALIVLPVAGTGGKRMVAPPLLEEAEPLLLEAASRWRSGDILYLDAYSQYAFRYYTECHDCGPIADVARRLWPSRPSLGGQAQTSPAITSRSPSLVVADSSAIDEARLEGHSRVWLLFTHLFPRTDADVLAQVDRLGMQSMCTRGGAALLCLYDFSRPRPR